MPPFNSTPREPALAWLRKSGFPRVSDSDLESRKLNLLRIAIGVIACFRFGKIAWAAYYFYPAASGLPISRQFLVSAAMTTLLALYSLGILTPLVGLILVLSYWPASTYADSQNLGDSIFLIATWVILLSNGGAKFSVDALLMKRSPRIRRWYAFLGFPNPEQQTFLYFCGYLTYALVSMAAITLHVSDEAWRSGMTLKLMLLSSYICRFYATFRALEASHPGLLDAISIMAAIGQTVFQIFMIPLVFHRLGLIFVRVWGMIFFIACAVFIQLSYLPYLELLLWPLLLFPMPNRRPSPSNISLDPVRSIHVSRAIALSFLGSVTLFLFSQIPIDRIRIESSVAMNVLSALGYVVPNVFNKEDLKTGERWPVISRVFEDGREELVPLNNAEGARERYHLADTLYFGNSLLWRRYMIHKDAAIEHRIHGTGYNLVNQLCHFDRQLHRPVGLSHYRVRIYGNDFGDLSLADLEARYRTRLLYAFSIPQSSIRTE